MEQLRSVLGDRPDVWGQGLLFAYSGLDGALAACHILGIDGLEPAASAFPRGEGPRAKV